MRSETLLAAPSMSGDFLEISVEERTWTKKWHVSHSPEEWSSLSQKSHSKVVSQTKNISQSC